jgi:stage V sporulation protein AA
MTFPEVEMEVISSEDCLVYIGKSPQRQAKWFIAFKVCLVATLLFIGSALAVMNFHEDVGMHAVHSKVYKFLTGRKFENPFIIQIPYTIGIGLGMIIFFNHFSKGKIDKHQPSPLEIEVFTYEKEKDECMIDLYKNQVEQEENENDKNTT